MLVGVNNHSLTTINSCALRVDETAETDIWVLETFLEVMNGKKPIFVVTDRDKAMCRAILQTLPYANHRLCQWHIQRNAMTNIRIQDFV